MKYFLLGLLTVPVLSHAITFEALCDQAYKASGEIIQTNGRILSNSYEKSSALAYDPFSLEGSASSIKGKDSADSGIRYGTMVNFQLKKPAFQDAQAQFYDQNSKTLHQEVLQQQGLIQVALKRNWLIATIEQEKINILTEKVTSAKESYTIGSRKVEAGRMSQMELHRLSSDVNMAGAELALAKMEFEHAQHTLRESAMVDKEIIVDNLSFRFIHDDNTTPMRIDNAILLQTLDAQIAMIDAQMKSIRYEGSESIGFGAGATHEPTQNSVDFRITIPLALSEKNDKRIAALMSEKSALLHRRDITHKKLQMNIHTLLEHLQTREQQYNDAVLAQQQLKNLMDIVAKGYMGGVASQFEYLVAKNNYYDAKLRGVDLKRQYIEEMAAMEEKLGRIWE